MNDKLTLFISELKSKSAKNMWRRGVFLFCQFTGKDVDTILSERKDDLTPRENENVIDQKFRASNYEKLLENFHSYLISPTAVREAYSLNTAKTYCTGVLQLFRFYQMPIPLRKGSPITQATVALDDFPLKIEHVRAMFHSAKDLRSKVLLALGKDTGMDLGSVVKLRKKDIPNLEQTPPIEWKIRRPKTNKIHWTFLSAETVALLKEYFFAFPKPNPTDFVFYSNGSHISQHTVNRRLRDLAEDAQIDFNGKRIHWHLFRKIIISTAKNLKIDPDIIRLLVGKSVNLSILTYMNDVSMKEAFQKLQEQLTLTTIVEADFNVTELKREHEQQLSKLGEIIINLETKIEALKAQVNNIENANRVIIKFLKQKGVPDEVFDLTKKSFPRDLTEEEAKEEAEH